MAANFAAWPIDILVYLVPGYVVLLAVMYAFHPGKVSATADKLGAGEVLASAVAALLLGLLVHQVATLLLEVSQKWPAVPTFSDHVRGFQHASAVHETITKHLGFKPIDVVDSYFYGRLLVAERAPQAAASAERLLGLANICQNMVLAVFLAVVILQRAKRVRELNRAWRVVGTIAVVFVLDGVFTLGMIAYWRAAVWRVLRATLLLG